MEGNLASPRDSSSQCGDRNVPRGGSEPKEVPTGENRVQRRHAVDPIHEVERVHVPDDRHYSKDEKANGERRNGPLGRAEQSGTGNATSGHLAYASPPRRKASTIVGEANRRKTEERSEDDGQRISQG